MAGGRVQPSSGATKTLFESCTKAFGFGRTCVLGVTCPTNIGGVGTLEQPATNISRDIIANLIQ